MNMRWTAVAAVALAVAASPAAFGAGAAVAGAGAAELERGFWQCDHAASRTMLDMETAARCSRVTDELRRQRFDGDFHAFLAWWQERKAAEHAALDAAAASTSAAGPPPAARPARAEPPARAANPGQTLDGATPEQLKAAFLHCDRLATTEQFDADAAAACSVVYEALKARVFDGSTERLITWMRQQPAAAAGYGAGTPR
ncbi:MAG: hypothetical protein KIT17_16335 [Rubrivivax sp.]|nr:hypothetical protein [Rubrivivax sp.]